MKICYSARLIVAAVMLAGAPTLVQAKPARTQPDPQVFDLAEPSNIARQASKPSTQPDCFVEPEGFHSQIRWDGDCVKSRQLRQQGTTSTEPTRFEAPRGLHSQSR